MIVVLSPSKTMDFSDEVRAPEFTQPELLAESKKLVSELKRLSVEELQDLYGTSEKIAKLNFERFKSFRTPFTEENSRQALIAFRGDVYRGFDLQSYTNSDYRFAQRYIRILSGLYGLLRPLDLIQPYRLEMGTELHTTRAKNLYEFWGDRITNAINEALPVKGGVVVNLASNEYWKAVKRDRVRAEVLDVAFKEKKGSAYKVIGLFAKRARGEMANFIVKHRITKPADLTSFTEDGYSFAPKLSTDSAFVFTRG